MTKTDMRNFRCNEKSVVSGDFLSRPSDPRDDRGGLDVGGSLSSNNLRIPMSLEKREQLLSDLEHQSQVLVNNSQLTSTKQQIPKYSSLPTKRWPFIAIFKTKPILPKQIMYDQAVSPWTRTFKNDGIKRIDHITYYAGTLPIYLTSHNWLDHLVKFSKSNPPKEAYDITPSSQQVQFLDKGVEPSLSKEERDERTGQPISIAMVEGQRNMRDDLCSQQFCSFNCFEINFVMKSNYEQDDFIFPQCNICQHWGHWCQHCPNPSHKDVVTVGIPLTVRINVPVQINIAQIVKDSIRLFTKDAQNSKITGPGLRILQVAPKLNSLLPTSSFRQDANSNFSGFSGNVPSTQVVTMELLESKLDVACNKILMIMQARFTEAMLAFETKMSVLIDKLMNIQTIFSSCLPEQSYTTLKRANVFGKVARAAKKPNGGSRSQHEDDVVMDEDQSTSEFVARIIEAQSRLINNGTANLISNANAKKL
ncbi:hypothetical protein ACOME3_008822 [Neoechinorhynchus agilis]